MFKNFLIFIVILFTFAIQITNRPFFTKGESREALVVQDMLEQNNFVLPLRNGNEIPSKPPMFHWSSLLSSKIFGLNEFSIRLPSAIFAALSFFLTLLFTNSLSASLILASSFEFGRCATSSRVDMCFCFFLTLATFFIYKIITKKDNLILDFIFILLGLTGAVLSKGPAGLAFPAAITAIYAFKNFDFKSIYKEKSLYLILLAATCALAISAIWYYQAYLIGKENFLAVHLGRENIGRFVENDSEPGHIKPFYYSFIYLLQGFLPWSLILPFSFYQLWKKRDSLLKDKLMVFSLIWLAVYFTVVTITISKRVVYLLPAYPAFSYLIFKTFDKSDWSNRICTFINFIISFLAIAFIAILLMDNEAFELASSLGVKERDLEVAKVITKTLKAFLIPIAISMGLLLVTLTVERISNPIKAAIGILLFSLIINVMAYPSISNTLSPKYITGIFDRNANIVTFKDPYYSLSYYFNRDIKAVNEPGDYDYIIVSEDKLDEFKKGFGKRKPIFKSERPIIYGRYKAYIFSSTLN